MEDAHVVKIRREKVEKLRELGINPYPNDFKPTHHCADLNTRFADFDKEQLANVDETFTIAGRVMFLREFGKLAFVRLQDQSGQLQCSLSLDGVGAEHYQLFKEIIDMGDIFGVTGQMTRTNKGELTLQAQSFAILNKTIQPLPDKWHGLSDVEQRYRQRYVDLIVNEEARKVAFTRPKIMQAIREFMTKRNFTEVETPSLQTLAGGGHARPFSTHHNALGLDLSMRIALELDLKRLAVGGMERVYEMGRLYRNEGISVRHNPEFTMLESYEAYADYKDVMNFVEDMITDVTEKVCGSLEIPYGEHTVNMAKPWKRLTMREALLEIGGAVESDLASLESLSTFATKNGFEIDEWADYGQAFLTCFEETCEAKLINPTFVYDYPRSTSPLSRCHDDNPEWVQRAELFITGREMANLYSELNDPADQKARFEAQQEEKQRGNDEAMPYDEDYIRALEFGLPPTGGLGVGIDRLVMLLTNQPSIRDVILFPLMRPAQREEEGSTSDGDTRKAG